MLVAGTELIFIFIFSFWTRQWSIYNCLTSAHSVSHWPSDTHSRYKSPKIIFDLLRVRMYMMPDAHCPFTLTYTSLKYSLNIHTVLLTTLPVRIRIFIGIHTRSLDLLNGNHTCNKYLIHLSYSSSPTTDTHSKKKQWERENCYLRLAR